MLPEAEGYPSVPEFPGVGFLNHGSVYYDNVTLTYCAVGGHPYARPLPHGDAPATTTHDKAEI